MLADDELRRWSAEKCSDTSRVFAMRSESPSHRRPECCTGTSTPTSTRPLERTAHTLGPLYADSLFARSPLSSSAPLP